MSNMYKIHRTCPTDSLFLEIIPQSTIMGSSIPKITCESRSSHFHTYVGYSYNGPKKTYSISHRDLGTVSYCISREMTEHEHQKFERKIGVRDPLSDLFISSDKDHIVKILKVAESVLGSERFIKCIV